MGVGKEQCSVVVGQDGGKSGSMSCLVCGQAEEEKGHERTCAGSPDLEMAAKVGCS